jgi:hypothetical protein
VSADFVNGPDNSRFEVGHSAVVAWWNASKIFHPDTYFPFPHFPFQKLLTGKENVGKENGRPRGRDF